MKSKYLVKFLGACLEEQTLSIVMEYCPNGSLYHHLYDASKEITYQHFFKWASDTLNGIDVLHSWNPPLVHRDIKTLNLLLDESMNIKVRHLYDYLIVGL